MIGTATDVGSARLLTSIGIVRVLNASKSVKAGHPDGDEEALHIQQSRGLFFSKIRELLEIQMRRYKASTGGHPLKGQPPGALSR